MGHPWEAVWGVLQPARGSVLDEGHKPIQSKGCWALSILICARGQGTQPTWSDVAGMQPSGSRPSLGPVCPVLANYASFTSKPRFPQLLDGDSSSACPVGLLNCVDSQMRVLISLKRGACSNG